MSRYKERPDHKPDTKNILSKQHNTESIGKALKELAQKIQFHTSGSLVKIEERTSPVVEYANERVSIKIRLADGNIKDMILSCQLYTTELEGNEHYWKSDVAIYESGSELYKVGQRRYFLEHNDFPTNLLDVSSNLNVKPEYKRLGIGTALLSADDDLHKFFEEFVHTIRPEISHVLITYIDGTEGREEGWTSRRLIERGQIVTDFEAKTFRLLRPQRTRS